MRRREFLRALTGGATTAFAAGAARFGAGPLGSAESRAATAADAPAAAAPAPAPDRKPVTLGVMTFNIHHAEGTDKRLDLDRIARVIRAAEPDLVALQEVDRDTTRGRRRGARGPPGGGAGEGGGRGRPARRPETRGGV